MIEFYEGVVLRDDVISLELIKTVQSDGKHLPLYEFFITLLPDGEVMGRIELRIGMNDYCVPNGNIGYAVVSQFRGNGYAPRACVLLARLAKMHGQNELIVTTSLANESSKRVLEKIGASYAGIIRVPEDHELYRDGRHEVCLYKWRLDDVGEYGSNKSEDTRRN